MAVTDLLCWVSWQDIHDNFKRLLRLRVFFVCFVFVFLKWGSLDCSWKSRKRSSSWNVLRCSFVVMLVAVSYALPSGVAGFFRLFFFFWWWQLFWDRVTFISGLKFILYSSMTLNLWSSLLNLPNVEIMACVTLLSLCGAGLGPGLYAC